MSTSTIRNALASLEEYFQSGRVSGPRPDTPATAVVEPGLRCRVHAPDGKELHTDMSEAFGGKGKFNSPGWLARAALASCDATALAVHAIRLGVELDSIEVEVEASSDGRGMFLDGDISPGSCDMRVRFRVGAGKVPREQIQEMVDWVVAHSPVGSDFEQHVRFDVDLELI